MDNLKKQEPRKEFEIYESGDRKFKLTRFDPMEGNYIVYQIMTYILPMGVSAQLSSEPWNRCWRDRKDRDTSTALPR